MEQPRPTIPPASPANPASQTPLAASPDAGVLRPRTPHLILGPFYPLHPVLPAHGLNAATACDQAGAARQTQHATQHRALHQALHISGQITNRAGQAVPQAWVELWQADELGRYRHPSAPLPEPQDASFIGYLAQRSDAQGRYAFHSRRPGAYVEGARRRAPHLHFQVTGAHDRLITQMFFPGDELNAQDHWLAAVAGQYQLVATLVHETPALLQLRWDIVLSTG